jgi:spore cortex formation protein SpoVR/YcgB (stage V sporulation)
MKTRTFIATGTDWSIEILDAFYTEIERISHDYALDTYPKQIEIITSEQMLDAYSMVGMPIGYHHWSFGKRFLSVAKEYRRGHMGLAYEIVINSNPSIAYLMEENTMMMQALVIAHACYGHNAFFKGNYLFKTWTNPESIIDYLIFARHYISQCEERYGIEAVESTLDSCHALMQFGVDKYQHPAKLSLLEEKARQESREAYLQSQVNDLWRTIPKQDEQEDKQHHHRFPQEPQENILYFIEKHAPLLEPWQREVVRIVRKIAQYFYPQRQTQVMNEGWACFWHYRIINDLYDQSLVNDDFMMEFLQAHTNVIFQPEFDSPFYSGINPYTLGFNMMMDIRRICENPTDEDKAYFPDIAGSSWQKTLDFAMRNFKDESFIAQFLSPKIIRDLKLFSVLDDESEDVLSISAIHDEKGYKSIRHALSKQYNLGDNEPNIQVLQVDIRGDRSLTLQHTQYNGKTLHPEITNDVLKHVYRLWGFPIHLQTVDEAGKIIHEFHHP